MRSLRLLVCVAVLAAGLAVGGGSPAAVAQSGNPQSVAQQCFEHHKFGAQPVDVAKAADGQTVLAQTSWNWHDAIGCYLTLDDNALAVLRAAPAPQSLPDAETEASMQCFEHHKFGQRPVDVAKTADRQTVLARLSWGYHDTIGCFLVLDDTALATLRANATTTTQPDADDSTDTDTGTEDTTGTDDTDDTDTGTEDTTGTDDTDDTDTGTEDTTGTDDTDDTDTGTEDTTDTDDTDTGTEDTTGTDDTDDTDTGTEDTTDTDDTDEPASALIFEGREVLAQQEVSTAGATVSHGEVSVSVPAGALTSQAHVAVHEPFGELDGEVGGEIVSVNHQGPVLEPITVKWDVSHLSEPQQQTLVLARWDAELEDWIPGNANYAIANGILTAEIQEWSFWTWLANLIQTIQQPAQTPSNTNTVISAGWSRSCGITADGTALCWGSSARVGVPPGDRFTSISVTGNHTCGITADGTAKCWGSNFWGQTDVPAGRFTAISAGGNHTCGITADGAAQCWGNNYWGQSDAPQGQFVAISAGHEHSCGIVANGTAQCWGGSGHGESDAPAGRFIAISAGRESCGITADGTAQCWGSHWGVRTDVPAGRFTAISTGQDHACGITADGTAKCWGSHRFGQLDVPEGGYTAIAAGSQFTCGITTGGVAKCWGHNNWGQADAPANIFVTPLDGEPDIPGDDPSDPESSTPAKIKDVKVAERSGDLVLSWSPPDDGGSAIEEYELLYRRYGETQWAYSVHLGTSRARLTTGLKSGESYEIVVRAVNSVGNGPWSDQVLGTIRRPYIDNNPILDGSFDFWNRIQCGRGGTHSCWKQVQNGINPNPFDSHGADLDTYFIRENPKVFDLVRYIRSDDFWGTNGYHVAHIGHDNNSDKNPSAEWNFNDVAPGTYNVGVYIPFINNSDGVRPGAIAKYRVYVDNRIVGTTEINQSIQNGRGQWVVFWQVQLDSRSDVKITANEFGQARSSCNQDWCYHLAADAARLVPDRIEPDWRDLGHPYDVAVAWCQTDVIVKLYLEPTINVLEGQVKDLATDALITVVLIAAGAVVTYFSGGATGPIAAGIVATRVGLSFKTGLTIYITLKNLRLIYEALSDLDSLIGNVDALTTLATSIGYLTIDGSQTVSDLTSLCSKEYVWENYYGDRKLRDEIKFRAIEIVGKLIDLLPG